MWSYVPLFLMGEKEVLGNLAEPDGHLAVATEILHVLHGLTEGFLSELLRQFGIPAEGKDVAVNISEI